MEDGQTLYYKMRIIEDRLDSWNPNFDTFREHDELVKEYQKIKQQYSNACELDDC
ncbi:MAG: hypothetical protein IB618_01555 [Candidatus Pacearchaeota archaeon]|nr:MAG: hypothetical protein IB618_01555 [Candidatus Pacearchaeota archaeon]